MPGPSGNPVWSDVAERWAKSDHLDDLFLEVLTIDPATDRPTPINVRVPHPVHVQVTIREVARPTSAAHLWRAIAYADVRGVERIMALIDVLEDAGDARPATGSWSERITSLLRMREQLNAIPTFLPS